MSFGEAVRSVFANYAKFDGRAPRSEYWWFQLFNVLVIVAVYIVLIAGVAVGRGSHSIAAVVLAILGIYLIATIIPSLAVLVRRLHDSDKTGWWLLIGLIPWIGAIILFIFTLLPSTPGVNRFGPPYGMAGDIRKVNYRAPSPQETWAQYNEDAQRAAANGYEPSSQQWRRDWLGDYLEVVYTRIPAHWQPGGAGWQTTNQAWQAPNQTWQATPPDPMGGSGARPAARNPLDGPPPERPGGA
jgi:uncharacterized membrane protein YhaH (DUF805 family)